MPDERFSLTVCPWSAAHPRHDHQQIFPLRDGRLMLIWSEYYADRPSFVTRTPYSREGSQTDLMPCRLSARLSGDRGRSWSDTFTVQENFAPHNVKHPCLLRLPSGEVLLFFSAWWSDTERRIYVKRSADDCETWSEPEQISELPGFYCINHDHALRLRSGRVILPAFVSPVVWKEGEHFRAFCYYSDDDGRTWARSERWMDLPGRGAEEPMVVELEDGSLFCVLRSTLGKAFKSISRDGGVTWDDPAPTGLVSCESEQCIARIPTTGDLLLLWNNVDTPRNRPRNPLTAAVSRDEGGTWSGFKDVENRAGFDSGYPAVSFVGDEALVTYYHASRSMARDCWVELKIYPISWFYE